MAITVSLDKDEVVASAPTLDALLPLLRYASEMGYPATLTESVQEQPVVIIPLPQPERLDELVQFLMTVWAIANEEHFRSSVGALLESVPQNVKTLKR